MLVLHSTRVEAVGTEAAEEAPALSEMVCHVLNRSWELLVQVFRPIYRVHISCSLD